MTITKTVHISDKFVLGAPPQAVFAFIVEPANLARWQTVKTFATPLSEGSPRAGYRIREGTRVGPRRWEQTIEFTEFEPDRVLGVRVIDGPPSNGRWELSPDGTGTQVRFAAAFDVPRPMAGLMRSMIRRQFRGFHRTLDDELKRATLT